MDMRILQTLNSNLLLLHVWHYAFTLATKKILQKAETFPLSTQCTSMCFNTSLLLLKSFWQQGQESFSLSSSDSLFSSTSHSSVLSMYIFWHIAHLQFSACMLLVTNSVSNRLSILSMFASSRSSYSAPSAPTPTPRTSFRPCMEMFFLMRQITKLG